MKIGIVGCAGRMGRMLVAATLAGDGCELAGGTELAGGRHIGADLGALAGLEPAGIAVTDDAAALFEAADAVIDFTVATATERHAELAGQYGTAMVLGTTGLEAAAERAIEKASRSAAIVQAANFSLGVNLLIGLGRQVAGILGDDYDIEILEMHHRHKVDAPSGTALALGRAAAAGRGVDPDAVFDRVRDGHTGARTKGRIGFATLRGGDVIGDHTVIFAADGERLELAHKATSRAVFVKGALHAAIWSSSQPPGLYGMGDVLGFS